MSKRDSKRKIIICSRYDKEKQHFGKGMCSPCLRQVKRRTKPSFYLGTCYSEIKRRCTHKHKTRNNKYFGMKYPTKVEFVERFINDIEFLDQYKKWQDGDFKRGLAPSIDRIDNELEYDIDNLRFIDNVTNGTKDCSMEVAAYKEGKLIDVYESMNEAARQTGCNPGSVHASINKGYKIKGYNFRRTYGE